MANLGIYLADLPGIVKWPAPLRQRVEEFFTQVVKARGKFDGATVEWKKSAPTLGAHDLLVYFVRDRRDTIVKPGINPKETIHSVPHRRPGPDKKANRRNGHDSIDTHRVCHGALCGIGGATVADSRRAGDQRRPAQGAR